MDIDGKLYCPRCMRVIEREGPCPHCGHGPDEPRPPMALEPGTLLNRRYQLGSVIGQGGFGITYAAWDETLGMPVAIKEYFPSSEAARDPDESDDLVPLPGHEAVYLDGLNRFRRESNLLASLQGIPCVVKVLDFFGENETAYLVMEFVHGVPVDQWVREAKIRPRDLIAKLRPVLDALVRTHSQGVIHRDITPDNLLVTEDGSFRLIDFGSAVEVERSSGTIVLTRKYAPVEQYGREYGALGPWTDVYGLAAVIYELVSGQEPVESPLRAHHDGMKPLARMKTGLKRAEAAAVTDALTVAPEKRTQSMAEFRARLYNLPLPEEVRKRKRFIRRVSVAAAVLLLLAALAVANFTTGLPLGNGLLYSFAGDGVYIVRELNRQEERELPASVLGVPVKGVKADAFRGDETLTRVTVPGNVKKIEDTAFYGCGNLKEATLAEGVEEIGLSAFGGCNQMITLTVPVTVTAIGDGALPADAPELTVWGSRGSAAETYANEKDLRFADAAELTWTIEDGQATLTSVQTDALRLTLPNYVDGVPVTAIREGVHLLTQEEVWLPEYLVIIPTELFYDFTEEVHAELSQVRIGSHVQEIGNSAFRRCLLLHEIKLPDTLEVIGDYAFYLIVNLPEITLPDRLKSIGEYAFASTDLTEIQFPDNLTSIGGHAFTLTEIVELHLPDSLTDIAPYAFASMENLETVTLPSGITSLPEDLFWGSGLKTIVLPDSIIEIKEWAFSNSDLQWISMPEGLQIIGDCVFYGCKDLSYVGIPESVTSIGYSILHESYDAIIVGHEGSVAEQYAKDENILFENMDKWTTPNYISNGKAVYTNECEEETITVPWFDPQNNIFITDTFLHSKNPCVREIILPLKQDTISSYSFAMLPSLEKVTTKGEIISIEDGAFFQDTVLRDVPLSYVTYIGEAALRECPCIEGIKLPDRLKELGECAFSHCASLTYAIIPSHLRYMKESLEYCDNLQVVVFSEGATITDEKAIQYCQNLRTVYFSSTISILGNGWLDGCDTQISDIWFFNPQTVIKKTGLANYGLRKLTIHGYAGSTAEAWADINSDKGVRFEPIPDGEPMPSPDEIIASFEFHE